MSEAIVQEYEVFKNARDALAFFFYRQVSLDDAPAEGPFWFSVNNDTITAGTESSHAIFQGVKPNIVSVAKRRGVIMLVEFENQQPVRCTPCYLSDSF
jgi:hypothetical protein